MSKCQTRVFWKNIYQRNSPLLAYNFMNKLQVIRVIEFYSEILLCCK